MHFVFDTGSCSGEMARMSPMASASPGMIFDFPDTVALPPGFDSTAAPPTIIPTL